MKFSPQWDGFIVERDDKAQKLALNCSTGDVVFFDRVGVAPGANARPIAIRRVGSEQVESLNVGHSARWKRFMHAEEQNLAQAQTLLPVPIVIDPALGDDMMVIMSPGKIWQVRQQESRVHWVHRYDQVRGDCEVTAIGLEMLQYAAQDQMDALKYALLHNMSNEIDKLMTEQPALEPYPVSEDPAVYDAAMGALVGKVKERKPLDVRPPIDDEPTMMLRQGIRDGDGPADDRWRKKYMAPKAAKRPRRAPFGVDTMAPQSGFCSSGVVFAAIPED